jgi:SAM-dependent methyltransferase
MLLPRGEVVDWDRWQTVSRAHFMRVAPQYDAGRAFERGEFWAKEIASQIPVCEKDWLLDLGCGTGLFAHAFNQVLGCQVVGLDLSAVMLEQARAKAFANNHWAQGRGETLSFRAESFQAIFLSQVWHHLEDSASAAREFRRVLKPGGGLFIKTYSHSQLRGRWDLTTVFPELLPFMLDIYPDVPELSALLYHAEFKRVAHKSFCKNELLRPSTLLHVAENSLWSMFAYLSEPGRARGIAYLKQLIADTNDAPIPSAEVHLLVCAEK